MSDDFKRYKDLEIFQRPQCLIKTEGEKNLHIVEGTAKQLEQITLPVNVVAIAGLYRTGKSYLLNRLAGETSSGFVLGSSIQSETKGVWAWCKKHPKQKGQVLLLLDTEGLGDIDKGNADHDNKIFLLAALLSSTLVYNVMNVFKMDDLEKVATITEMSKNMRVLHTDPSDELFDFVMPNFVVCIRDFSSKLAINGIECTPDDYLAFCLREKENKSETYNLPRKLVKKYFTTRKLLVFKRPAYDVENLEFVAEDKLNEHFVQATERFRAYIFERPAKMLHNKRLVTGRMLTVSLKAFITAINNGSVPCVDDALTAMSKQENENKAKHAIEKFRSDIKRLNLPIGNEKELQSQKLKIKKSILQNLNSELLLDAKHVVEKSVESEMENIFKKEIEEENGRLIAEKCKSLITNIYTIKMKEKISKNAYIRSGGYQEYKRDMEDVLQTYETELCAEKIDTIQKHLAKNAFLTSKLVEAQAIMVEDQIITDMEKEVEIKREQEKRIAEKERHEKEYNQLMEEIERLRKQFDEDMAETRKKQEEREEENINSFIAEKVGLRKYIDMAIDWVNGCVAS